MSNASCLLSWLGRDVASQQFWSPLRTSKLSSSLHWALPQDLLPSSPGSIWLSEPVSVHIRHSSQATCLPFWNVINIQPYLYFAWISTELHSTTRNRNYSDGIVHLCMLKKNIGKYDIVIVNFLLIGFLPLSWVIMIDRKWLMIRLKIATLMLLWGSLMPLICTLLSTFFQLAFL